MAVGQSLTQLTEALQSGNIPQGVVYVRLTTPLGNATVDPFAAAQDPQTQAVLQGLGIGVEIGFGPAPVEPPGAPSLAGNLKTLGIAVAAFLLVRHVSRSR